MRIASAYALRNVSVPPTMSTEVSDSLKKAADDPHYWVREAAVEAQRILRLPGE